jgi:peroxiredoxin
MAPWNRKKLAQAGARAPGFRLPLLTGGEAALGELIADGPALLAFFKVSCPVCQLTLPFLERIHAAGGLRVYGVSQDDPADTADFAGRYGLSFPMLLDPEEQDYPAGNAFGISSVPSLFLVAANGTISSVSEGWSRRDVEELGRAAGVAVIRESDDVPAWKAG